LFNDTIWEIMSIKSSWAFRNGKSEMNKIIESQKAPLIGWVGSKYAERGKHNPNELYVKTYANKTQCKKKIDELTSIGILCEMSLNHPYTIIKI
jgi:hypothetical protein